MAKNDTIKEAITLLQGAQVLPSNEARCMRCILELEKLLTPNKMQTMGEIEAESTEGFKNPD